MRITNQLIVLTVAVLITILACVNQMYLLQGVYDELVYLNGINAEREYVAALIRSQS